MNYVNSLLLSIGGSKIVTYEGAAAADKLNNILTSAGMGVGGILVALAVMKLVMAMGDENVMSKANASIMLGTGIFFLSLSTIVELIGLTGTIGGSTPRIIAGNVIEIIGHLMEYAGGAMAVLGIFQYIMSIAQEQAESVQRATTVIGIGIALLSSGLVLGSIAIETRAGILTGNRTVNLVIDFIAGTATYIGGGMVIMGIFKLVNSLRQEDTPERNKAILLLVTGIGLISFRVIVGFIKS